MPPSAKGGLKRVAPRKGRVSRNDEWIRAADMMEVAPRKGRVSRNDITLNPTPDTRVAPRKGRVSRNNRCRGQHNSASGRAPQGACE